jgi:NAD(P)-dependent dehydrogenase (short-subunit alcohol dehydrogenase family)
MEHKTMGTLHAAGWVLVGMVLTGATIWLTRPSLMSSASPPRRAVGLVNDGGIVDVAGRVDEMSRERVDRRFRINVFGSIRCVREAVRRTSTRLGGAGGLARRHSILRRTAMNFDPPPQFGQIS